MPRQIPDIAVVGAGAAGMACAERLVEHGLQVQVFDKGRHAGGRVAQRHRMGLVFEHGAPGQRLLIERLNARVPVLSGCRITAVNRYERGWKLIADGAPLPGLFSGLVIAVPAPQAARLLVHVPRVATLLRSVVMRPILTAMVGLPGPLGRAWEVIRFSEGTLAEAHRQATLRVPGPEAWVLHAAAQFSRDNLECNPDAVARHLWQRFRNTLDLGNLHPIYLRGHRWRYGRTERALGRHCIHDADSGLGVCGDWCQGDTVDDALASGRTLAARILGLPERFERQQLAAQEEQA